MSELTPNMQKVLQAMRELREQGKYPPTPNEIAWQAGYRPGMAKPGKSGRGHGQRIMGPAVHVSTALTALRKRKLVGFGARRDGQSGTAYYLTDGS